MNLGIYAKFLFLYTVDQASNNFWAFSGGAYHRFVLVDNQYCYIRSQSFLPEGVWGACYGLTRAGYENLRRESGEHGFGLNFYDDATSCEQGEVLELHPTLIFGLSKPAGTFWQDNPLESRDEDYFKGG